MKRLIPIVLCLILFCGCGNDRYALEKKFWHLNRTAQRILSNPETAPRSEWNTVLTGFRSIIKHYPASKEALYAQLTTAKIHLARKNYADAREELIYVTEKYSSSPQTRSEALFLMGYSYEQQGNWNEALSYYRKVQVEHPNTDRAFKLPLHIAHYYRKTQQPEKTTQAYNAAIDYYKTVARKYAGKKIGFDAHHLLAQCYGETNDWNSALQTLEEITNTYQNKANLETVLLDTALIYRYQFKDTAKADEITQRLRRDYPNSRLNKAAAAFMEE